MSTDDAPTPVETYARLRLLEYALREAISEAAQAAEEWRRQVRAKQVETDHGLVSVTRRKPSIQVDDAALLQWAEEYAPHAITRTIAPAAKKAILAQYHISDDGDVVDSGTGEVLPWAWIQPGTESLTVRLTPEAKEHATRVLTGAVAADIATGFAAFLAATPEPPVIEHNLTHKE